MQCIYMYLHCVIQNVIVLWYDWSLGSWLACVMTWAFKYIIGWLHHVTTRSIQGLAVKLYLTYKFNIL
jgi:hypothetical protein